MLTLLGAGAVCMVWYCHTGLVKATSSVVTVSMGSAAATPNPRQSLVELHSAEVRDALWANAAEAAISSRLTELPGTKTVVISCRSTVCRVDVVHESVAAASEFRQKMREPSTRPWNGDVAVLRSGERELTMFIWREGSGSIKKI